jgi:hypothetical protein
MLRTLVIGYFLAVSAIPSAAQAATRVAYRPARQLDYFVSRFQTGAGQPLDGLGARVLWRLPGTLPLVRSAPAWAGLYGEHTPQERGLETWRFGGQADAAVLRGAALPLEGRVSLGLGVVHVRRQETAPVGITAGGPMFELRAAPRHHTTRGDLGVSFAPGIGARLGVGNGTGIRTDLRRIWELGGSAEVATQLSAGVSLPL